jgi:hypothetical protein
MNHGDRVVVLVGNGAVPLPGTIVGVCTNNTYSIKVKLKSGKEVPIHNVPRGDILFISRSEVIL